MIGVRAQSCHGLKTPRNSRLCLKASQRRSCAVGSLRTPEKASTTAATAVQTREDVSGALSSIIGGAGLVTGSMVGAGILALPAVTHSTGFGPTAVLLLSCWVVLQLEALLITEVNLHCHEQLKASQPEGTEIPPILLGDMTRLTLGARAEAACDSIYLTMSFTLLLAYAARAGGIIDGLSPIPNVPLGAIFFTAPLAYTLIKGGTPAAEKANRSLTGLMLAMFVGVVVWGFSHMPWETSPLSYADGSDAAATLPIMFLSLVYHDLIPVVCHYLGFRRSHILAAIFLGSMVPTGMFIAFEAVALGLVPYTPGVVIDPLDVLISSGGAVAGPAVALFSLAALATSAIGTTLAVTSFFRTKLETYTQINNLQLPLPDVSSSMSEPIESARAAFDKLHRRMTAPSTNPAVDKSITDTVRAPVSAAETPKSPETDAAPSSQQDVFQPTKAHITAVLLTLTPPTIASMSGTDIFMVATHLAGAYGMTALYGLLPPTLAWASRRDGSCNVNEEGQTCTLLPGGEPALAGLFAAGVAVGTLQLQEDLASGQVSAVQPELAYGVAADMLTMVSSVGGGAVDGLMHLM